MTPVRQAYWPTLVAHVGRAWNAFWFSPSDPIVCGALRLLTGLAAIVWYVSYASDLEFWFGPDGMVPLERAQSWRGIGEPVFLFDWVGSVASLWFFFGLGLIPILLFTVGLFSRAANVLSVYVVASLLQRGPMLAGPADDLLAMLLFYLCITPTGAAISVDRWWREKREMRGAFTGPSSVAGERKSQAFQATAPADFSPWATVGIRLLQIHTVAIYVLMVFGQLRGDVWWLGRAIWGLLGKPDSSLVDLSWLASHEYVLNFWTHGIVLFELSFAVLIWIPLARPILLAVGLLVWLSVAVASGWLLFCALIMLASLSFVPPAWLRQKTLIPAEFEAG